MKTINRSSAILTALAAFLISLPAQAAQKPPVPASGVYLGATLPSVNDLAYNEARTPAQFNADIGVNHAIFMAFLEFPGVMSALDEKARITTFIEECAGVGAIPAITLRVPGGLNSYTTQDIEAFADFLNSFNVPIFLRWCHEMNGSWYAWGQQPELYVQKFQEFATVIHSRATGVAMTWTPNQAAGYPWASGAYANPALTTADDPYDPYYPGDAYVDWVGFSYYHWGSGGPPDYARGYNQVPWSTEWRDASGANDPLKNFHDRFAVNHSKPMMIPETAALYDPSDIKGGGATEAAIKQEWINQVYNLSDLKTLFPQVKAICWFNIKKAEAEVSGPVDWRLDNVSAYYSNQVADSYFKKAVDSVAISSSPTLLTTTGTYSVTVQYATLENRDIILSILDPANGYAWYGAKRLSVTPGQGTATFTVAMPSTEFAELPPNGTTYVWDAIIAPTGGDNSNKLGQDTKLLIVDRTAQNAVTITSAPTMLITTNTYSVTVQYATLENREIVLSILDPANGYAWYGAKRLSVEPGQGTATFSVTVPSTEFAELPPNGTTYVWDAILVPLGGSDLNKVAQAPTRPLTVDNTAVDNVAFVSAPTALTNAGTYEVTVQYTARQDGEIVLSILDPANGYAWYGAQRQSVTVGQGTATFSVTVPSTEFAELPPNGTTYVWDAILVPPGGSDLNKVAQAPTTPLTVGDTVAVVSAPATITASGTYEVTVAYTARENRDIRLSLLDPANTYAWYGTQIQSVTVGQGNATFTVTLPGTDFPYFPPNGTTFVWEALLVPTGSDWNGKISENTKPLTVNVPAGYDAWKAGVFTASELNDPAISGDLATPANDGITNLMKYALCLDPMISGVGSKPTVSMQSGYLTFAYRKNKLATDVTYTVQVTDSLGSNSWLPATTLLSETDAGDFWLVTMRDNVPYGGNPKRFMRLQVSK